MYEVRAPRVAAQLTRPIKPGHEYTKSNCKFLAKVLPTEPVKRLQAFAEANQETQGKFTIGDEKVRRSRACANAAHINPAT